MTFFILKTTRLSTSLGKAYMEIKNLASACHNKVIELKNKEGK